MKKTLQVIDDFYSDPWAVRQMGLSRDDWLDPLRDGEHTFSRETRGLFFTPELVDTFSNLVGKRIHVDPKRVSFGVFAYYSAASDVRMTTHFDDTEWSVIVYLVPPEACSGGVSFYQHVPTGLHGPPDESTAREMGYENTQDFLERTYFPDKKHPDKWRQVDHVGMRFNRMVLLRGRHRFHRATSGFGESTDTARLTHRFFFDEIAA